MREVDFMGHDECPRCEKYKVATYVEVTSERKEDERPDGWKRFLPWNWRAPREWRSYEIKQCKNCRATVNIEEIETEE